MPLNYSKWDQLELSDDSDIEGHPNVDKRSLIRWKQRDIHEKRELRKATIARLEAGIACNKVLLPRITDISKTLSDPSSSMSATAYFNSLVQRLQTNPSKDCPPTNDPNKFEQTYDGMILSLLKQVSEDAKNKAKGTNVTESEKEERLGKALADIMADHVIRLGKTVEEDAVKLENELKEQRKHITSDDIHEGFESKYVPTKSEPPSAISAAKASKKGKSKETKAEYEVLNPEGVAAAEAAQQEREGSEEEEESLPEMTPNLEAFSKIPLKAYEKSFEFIQQHRDIFVPGASDALLVAAFKAQSDKKPKYAKQCVHQSLLLQYCEKLGRDGVAIFFKKMIAGDKRAEKVFIDDVENTYAHLVSRVEASIQESTGKEQIQLVPENPNQDITFNVPDGPPPEEIVLEGEEARKLDVGEVRKALQFRWDVFSGFSKEMQEALKGGKLGDVNKVLGDMDVPEAEYVVQQLDMAGILNFAEGGIRDQTGIEGSSSNSAVAA